MAIRTVITRGYGNGIFNGTIALVVTRGYAIGIGVYTGIPPTASLSLTPYVPVLDTAVIPGTLSVGLITFIPVLGTGVIPVTASLTLTGFIPVIATILLPGVVSLVLTPFISSRPVEEVARGIFLELFQPDIEI